MHSFLLADQEIGHYSGYKTRVIADYFFEITTIEDLEKLHEAYVFAGDHNLPFLIIGGGTNILFSSDRFHGVVVKNSISGWAYHEGEKLLRAYSNEPIWEIAVALKIKHNQPLWSRFVGLPGSIGGAVSGNAGCFGLETESNFARAIVYDMQNGESISLTKDEMHFDYRNSILKENPQYFLVEAYFDFREKNEKYASDVDVNYFRENKQPRGNCCGSFFKNPSRDISAGMLIESVGLKGYHHGGAYWSPLHANFLMSDGESCLPSDLIELIRLTQEKVKKEKGIDLVNEVRII